MNQVLGQVTDLFLKYSMKQRIIISAVLIAFVSVVIVLVLWSNRTEYDLLYSNLDPGAASSVVADLRNNKIPFRLENGGTTIYAPTESVSELRLRYAQNGYIKDSVTGYELFEENNMGMTTFMQRLNFKRALEGELMRTINQFPEVQKSRVHLVIPEDQLFESEKKGSASVVLYMRPNAGMKQGQIKGVASLVANSVNGIEPEDVVVMDEDGNVLADGKEEDGLLSGVGSQFELQQALESKLQKKVLALVGGVVGRNNAVVKIAAELNFDRIERTSEEIDPESATLVSEDNWSESSLGNTSDTSKYDAKKVVRNYDFNKTHETYVSNSGNVKRLTVAVLVNGYYTNKTGEDGKTIAEYKPRSEEELSQIASLVKSAVGYNEDRGDIIEVQNIQLAAKPVIKETGLLNDALPFDMWEKIITFVLLLVGILMAYKLLSGLLKTSISQLGLPAASAQQPALAGAGGGSVQGAISGSSSESESSVSEDLFMKKLSPEARAKMKANDKMTEEVIRFADENPENATKLLRSWITQAGIKNG